MESGESIVGTSDGVVKARDFRRRPENGGRWGKDMFDELKGAPWEPYPGAKGSVELQSKVRLPTEQGELTRPVRGTAEECAPRRFRIRRVDLEKYGFTAGCPGRRAANRGLTAVWRAEGRRERIEQE